MALYALDTSALAKLFLHEDGSTETAELLIGYRTAHSELVIAEFGSLLGRLIRSATLSGTTLSSCLHSS